MLKALFLDMDDTLCDTAAANEYAKMSMNNAIGEYYPELADKKIIADAYVKGIYRTWSDAERDRYLPIITEQSEGAFRIQLIHDLLSQQGISTVSNDIADTLQQKFDRDRLSAFDFYPGIKDFLADARKYFTLVVITNGPVFSQRPKVDAIELKKHVDHIIIGGEEPEQKPARSIFDKALSLANCHAHEACHIGDSLAADITGALNSGITSVWIKHQQPLDAELGINPHHTLLHPSEIPALIRDLSPDTLPLEP